MMFPRVSQLSLQDYLLGHTRLSLKSMFSSPPPPALKFGEDFLLSAKTPGLCQPATQRDTFVFE